MFDLSSVKGMLMLMLYPTEPDGTSHETILFHACFNSRGD